MKKNYLLLFIIVAFISILSVSCKKEDESKLFKGVIANKSQYTLTIKVLDASDNSEVKSTALSPSTKVNISLEERKYYFKAYQNDGSSYNTITMDIDGERNDATFDGETLDWLAVFN